MGGPFRFRPTIGALEYFQDVMTLPAIRTVLIVLVLAVARAAASQGVPDSLLPKPWSWENASLEGNPTAIRTGNALMFGGSMATLTGLALLFGDWVGAVSDEASADSKCLRTGDAAACAYEPRELSPVPPVLIAVGLTTLATGIVVALIARDDSGRDKRYYVLVGPGLVRAGIRGPLSSTRAHRASGRMQGRNSIVAR